MISPDRITISLPQTSADILDIAGDIITVAKAFRRGGEDKTDEHYIEFIQWLMEYPHVITMAYVDGKPAGYVRIDDPDANDELGRKCLELKGGVLEEYEGEGLSEIVTPIAIEKAFKRHPKQKKIICRLGTPDPKAAALLNILGFRYRETDEATGDRVYRLLKDRSNAS